MTKSGPDTGSPCIFPFTYDGTTYTECLSYNDAYYYVYYYYYYDNNPHNDGNSDGKWCSTQVMDLNENRRLQESPTIFPGGQ